jgi:hypothetical protein
VHSQTFRPLLRISQYSVYIRESLDYQAFYTLSFDAAVKHEQGSCPRLLSDWRVESNTIEDSSCTEPRRQTWMTRGFPARPRTLAVIAQVPIKTCTLLCEEEILVLPGKLCLSLTVPTNWRSRNLLNFWWNKFEITIAKTPNPHPHHDFNPQPPCRL